MTRFPAWMDWDVMFTEYLFEYGEFDADSRIGSLSVFMNLDLGIVDYNLSHFSLQALRLKAGFSIVGGF